MTEKYRAGERIVSSGVVSGFAPQDDEDLARAILPIYNGPPSSAQMAEIIEGNSDATGLRFGILAARFHDEIVSGLLAGALGCLQRHGAGEADVTIYRAPGSFELPGLAKQVASLGRYDALVALGVLIRGDTPHFEFISAQVTGDLSRVAIDERLPIALGVITCNTIEQAKARCGPGSGNKGWEAALAAIEMANLFKLIKRSNQLDLLRPDSTGKERS